MNYSKTYLGALLQFFITIGAITSVEAEVIGEGVAAVAALIALGVTLYGRLVANAPVNLWGVKQQ